GGGRAVPVERVGGANRRRPALVGRSFPTDARRGRLERGAGGRAADGNQGGDGRDRLWNVGLRVGGGFFRDAGASCGVVPTGEVHRGRGRARDGSGRSASARGGAARRQRGDDH